MAEIENKEVVQEEPKEPAQQQEPQYSELEQRAMEQGWMPKDKWVESGKAAEEHRSAKEFIDRTDLYKRIDSLNRDNKDLRKAINDLMDHNRKMDEVAYKRAMENLRSEKKQALEDGDADRVIDIDDQILDLKTAQRNAPSVPQVPELPPEFQDWVERNSWYKTDKALQSDADAAGLAYKRNNPHASASDVLDYVEKFIRKANPEKFQKQRAVPPSPDGGDRSANKPAPAQKGISLSEEETRAMKRFVRQGVMTEDEYKEQIKQMRARGA